MKNSTPVLLSVVLGVVLFLHNGYAADQKPKQTKVITEAEIAEAWQRKVPEMDLGDNLPLGEVVRHIGERFPEINFIVPESARSETVPRLVLRSVTLGEILKAIELASEGRIRGGVPGEAVAVDASGLPIRQTKEEAQGNMVTFRVGPLSGTSASAPKSPAVCRVFSLQPYLAYRSEKEAQTAIQQLYDALRIAWEMLKTHQRDVQEPNLTIHEGTKLLIAVGRVDELAVIDQVIRQLQGASGKQTVTSAENETDAKTTNTDKPAAPPRKQ